MESKVDKIDVDKLATVPDDLKKLSDVVDVLKRTVYYKFINAIDTSKLNNKTDYNAKIKYIENKIPSIINLTTSAALTTVGNKIPNVSTLVEEENYADKLKGIESKYFTSSDYNKFKNNVLDAKIKN